MKVVQKLKLHKYSKTKVTFNFGFYQSFFCNFSISIPFLVEKPNFSVTLVFVHFACITFPLF